MLTESLNYNLPAELVAQTPADSRTGSRLMVLNRRTGSFSDRKFGDILEYLTDKDCLVLNDTKVLPARFFARRSTGAKLEGLWLSDAPASTWVIMLKNSRRIKPGEKIIFCDKNDNDFCDAMAVEKLDDGRWVIKIDHSLDTGEILSQIGFAPLPPYIKRTNDKFMAQKDLERYQTVYAKETGAVAAPTAGLHFTDDLLDTIRQIGTNIARVTLHVGAGTFKPVTAENLLDHEIHSERYSIDEENAAIINQTKQNGGRIIAVGTTSVRTLETVAKDAAMTACQGDTRLFITPGYEYKIVDAMVTNFHLPKSTLLALVGAFAGMDEMMAAYRHAVDQRYRFFSYGDAMLIV